jgi:hypothetical protein
MANSNRAPKQWQLTPNETLNSFKNWKENLVYTLSLDKSFKPFLKDGVIWEKLTSTTPNRGFADDDAEVTTDPQKKEDKVATLNLMLGQIANYATIISRNQIIKSSTSLNDIWDKIRQHYGFHTTGSRFLDLTNIRLSGGERPEDLFQRLVSFMDDNLLTKDCALTHHSSKVEKDEEISPTLENVVVLLWLERLHVSLPALIKQRYGAELRNKTLASIKPEISQALSSLLEELSSGDDSRIMRAQAFSANRRGGGRPSSYNNNNSNYNNNNSNQSRSGKYCCLCRTANRPGHETHFLSQCRFLPESDRKRMSTSRVRTVDAVEYNNHEDYDYDYSGDHEYYQDPSDDADHHGVSHSNSQTNTLIHHGNNSLQQQTPIHRRVPCLVSIHRRVTTRKSPIMQCFYRHIAISLCLDTGAETNLISDTITKLLNLQFSKTNQGALQGDEKAPLDVIGEITGVKINKGAFVFTLDALVIKSDMNYIVAGEPFLELNDIALRPARRIITIQGRETIPYSSSSF